MLTLTAIAPASASPEAAFLVSNRLSKCVDLLRRGVFITIRETERTQLAACIDFRSKGIKLPAVLDHLPRESSAVLQQRGKLMIRNLHFPSAFFRFMASWKRSAQPGFT